MSALSSYLAKNYLSSSTISQAADLSDRPKKRRKKDKNAPDQSTTNTTLIVDDDEDLLFPSTSKAQDGRAEDDDNPMVYRDVNGKAARNGGEFRKKKSSVWKTVEDSATNAPTAEENGGDEDAEADKILQQATRDQQSRRLEGEVDDMPTVVVNAGPVMESGVRAGLQTAADTERLAAEEAAAKRAEEKALRRARKAGTLQEKAVEETIYRDATGRRIDVSAKRAEAQAEKREEERRKRKEKEEMGGEVQKQQREERREELKEARFLTVARGVDDEEMNEGLKGVRRWGDPMAGYMVSKEAEKEGGEERSGGFIVKGEVKTGKKVYQGHAPPNRYGIAPGWRWDGVDRGNGFEKEWFQARSKKARNEDLSYQWQMDE